MLTKLSGFVQASFDYHAEIFPKKVRLFAPKFYKNKSFDFRKELSNCL